MSTTHSTSDQEHPRQQISYTVVGGRRDGRLARYNSRLTIVVISREGKLYRDEFLARFHDHPLAEILYVDGQAGSYDVEARSRRYPRVRFLLLKEPTSIGETINLAMEESRSPQVLVMWSNMDLRKLTAPLLDRLTLENAICVVPHLVTDRGEAVPSITIPVFVRRNPRAVPLAEPGTHGMCLYPFDFSGVYNKARFDEIGGFDPGIANPYWQKLEFGFRALMWGEKIVHNADLQLQYLGAVATEDTTRDAGYKRFFLKSVAVRIRRGMATLPRLVTIPYLLKSGVNPISALGEFRSVRSWVRANRDRFVREARGLADLWELPE